eukprot:240299_1
MSSYSFNCVSCKQIRATLQGDNLTIVGNCSVGHYPPANWDSKWLKCSDCNQYAMMDCAPNNEKGKDNNDEIANADDGLHYTQSTHTILQNLENPKIDCGAKNSAEKQRAIPSTNTPKMDTAHHVPIPIDKSQKSMPVTTDDENNNTKLPNVTTQKPIPLHATHDEQGDIKTLRQLREDLFDCHNADPPMKDTTHDQKPMTSPLPSLPTPQTLITIHDITQTPIPTPQTLITIHDITQTPIPTPQTLITIHDITQTTIPFQYCPFQHIDQGLETYYHRHGSFHHTMEEAIESEDGIFMRCMNHNCFAEDDVETELGKDCKPNECAYVWALNDFLSPLSFPIPSYLHIPEENKDIFMFYILQWIYTHNACPSDANIKDSIMPLAAGELVHAHRFENPNPDHILEDASLITDVPQVSPTPSHDT